MSDHDQYLANCKAYENLSKRRSQLAKDIVTGLVEKDRGRKEIAQLEEAIDFIYASMREFQDKN